MRALMLFSLLGNASKTWRKARMRKAEIRRYGRNNCQTAERIFKKFYAGEFDEKICTEI